MKLLEAENKEQKQEIENLQKTKKIVSFGAENIEELVKNSKSFFKYLLFVEDKFYSIFYYKDENRIYIEKSLFRLKIESIFSRNISDDEMLDVIKSINAKNYMKLGFKPLLDDFRELDFEIEGEAFNGKWIFINMISEESELIRSIKKLAKNLKSGKRLSLENNSEIKSFKNNDGGNDE